MIRPNAAVLAVVGLAMGLGMAGQPSSAQGFPNQPVRLVSPFPGGSGPDVASRVVGERLGAAWKQPVLVDPRPGASGFIAASAVKQAAPTGYDLLVADVGVLSVNPSLFKSLPYAPKTDFVPVGAFYSLSFFIVVGNNSPIHSVKDLIATATSSPGKITYGSNAVGGPLHIGGAQVQALTGTQMVHVPYKDISQLYVAVSTGEVDWALASLGSAGPLLKAGKLRLVALADTPRSAFMPNVPTFEESGGPKGLSVRSWLALMAPKGTPAAVVATINQTLNEVLAQPEVAEKFAAFGFVPYPLAPAALTSLIASESTFYAEMVKRTGASPE
ncbi:MAG: tripartite tricarboxylate transporter substrate binding protein [Rhodoferax sp.]|nr:tripartite tricarboxylate transporter substrate binding protein [Rhodoferax sp.]